MALTVQARDRDAACRLEALGRAGLTVSVCCGPCGSTAFGWSVTVLSRDGCEFDRPFAAESFAHAVDIAEMESRARGWLTGTRGQ